MAEPRALSKVVEETTQKSGAEKFQLESSRMLEVNLTGEPVWTKLGTMIAYRGDLHFERERMLEHGLGIALKRMFSGETKPLMKVTGRGALYVADSGKHITLLKLQNESLYVNGNDLLAFEPSIQWNVRMIRRIAGTDAFRRRWIRDRAAVRGEGDPGGAAAPPLNDRGVPVNRGINV